ncbi:E3 ubiquitin-protein ligase ARI8 [Pyrus ussuriensis x Pyrus communis]|uniref:E3 ubiquitin-protein ligase ARI8 n=1 Tax=Pyrus ussuriensis x Pyrus communis TaxID=2448454 RepID=A0A5N5H1Y3_9ROSA|nr:E3 ubiquitin-protein ligase ARI8 [Pyrus ussuriensis x Pyrus communis]
MASSIMKGRAWTRKEDEALCKAYRLVSKDSVRGNCQTNDGLYECTTPMNIRNHKSCSSRWKKYLQPSLNKWHQTLLAATSRHESGANYYDKGEANDDYAAQHEVVASLRLLAEQNALEAEERKCRHEERTKQIQEEMDDKNMEMNTSNYSPMSKAYFDRKKKKEIMSRRQLFTSDYTPTMTDDKDDVDYGY